MEKYNVAIVGGGIGGLMAAYTLVRGKPGLSIVLFERGNDITKRSCPIISGRAKSCTRCAPCAIMEGLAGAGAFSDGKYVISTEYGGWLTDVLAPETVMSYIEKADGILMEYGAPSDRFMPDNELKTLCLRYDLHMQQAELKHLGTDANFLTMKNMIDDLSGRIDIRTRANVTDVDKEKHILTVDSGGKTECFEADEIIMAPGRAGSGFLSDWCEKNGIPMMNNQVDVGVRVELPAEVWEHFSSRIYEPKIWYRSKSYGDTTRMFCFNERGSVVVENTDGILTVNGHAYKDKEKKTANSNFALLSTIRFTKPFDQPVRYAKYVASLANLISGGSVLLQRLGDLEEGRRSNEHRIAQSTTCPTLQAVPGDLSLCMPKRQLDNIIETLHALDKVAPGTANYDTLLYGVECKYYSSRPLCEDFEIHNCEGIYVVGDGGGYTRSLSHAAANGLYVADKILSRIGD